MKKLRKLFYWYFAKNTLPYWCIFIIDCIFVFLSLILVYTFNGTGTYTLSILGPLCGTAAVYTLLYALCFTLLQTYQGIIRYSSFIDLQRVGIAMCIGAVLSLTVKYFNGLTGPLIPLRARDIVMGTIMATALIWASRVIVKHIYDLVFRRAEAENVFIYGVREGGISIAKSIRNQDPANYIVTGFTSEDPTMEGRMLMGVSVYPFDTNLMKVMQEAETKILFVSPMRSESLRNNQEMVDALIGAGIKIYMVPNEQKWEEHKESNLTHQHMQEVSIEDLLPREQIKIDIKTIGDQLQDKRILITGAAGSIGSELVRQVSVFNPGELMLIDQAETPLHDIRLMMAKHYPHVKAHTVVADITNVNHMSRIFDRFKPEYVLHAAAYKHVPMMEDNPSQSVQNNIEGTRIVADLAVKNGCNKFVMISTDKAVNPTNVMGCSKRVCEIYVQSLDKAIKEHKVLGETQFVTTRFGNVLGSNGSVIPLFKEQIRQGGPLTVTHPEIIRYFMLIPEACKLVLEACTMGHGGEIYVFDMGKPVKIVDLARRMIQLSGTKCEIKFTGLRDGEKLYEEVFNPNEKTLPTFHPQIKIAKVREYGYSDVNAMIDELVESTKSDDDMSIVRLMKKMVPEYKSQHSIYEKLDKENN